MKQRIGKKAVVIGVTKNSRKGVSCVGCGFLAFIEGMPPLCLHKATYVDGAIYRKVDITGTAPAEEVNKKRNCPNWKRFSLRASGIRRYMYADAAKGGKKHGKNNR